MTADRPEGLRERKKQATRAAIKRAALALLHRQGYDETSTEEIARAANVSPSTLFNYFPTKESLFVDEYDPFFLHLLESRPPDEPMITAIRKALETGLGAIVKEERDLVLARAKLALTVPGLRAAHMLDRERSATMLREFLARRYGGKIDDFELRVTTAVIASAITTAMETWLEGGGKADVMKLVGRALDVAELGTRFEGRLKGRR